MKFISHRGNVSGRDLEKENNPAYIDSAIKNGFLVEVDLRFENGGLFLGHDFADFPITADWLLSRKNDLYVHAKSLETVQFMVESGMGLNYFFHDIDDCTITSLGEVWVHPNSSVIPGCIFVMPEVRDLHIDDLSFCSGICSDFVLNYRQSYNKNEVPCNDRQENKRSSLSD